MKQRIKKRTYKRIQTKLQRAKSQNKVVDLSQQKYTVKDIDQSHQYYYVSQIFKNEKYRAYGGDDLLLEIYDLELDQLITEIRQDYGITKNFKLNQKLYLHHDYVLNLITIKHQFIITTCYDKMIIKTDTKYKKQYNQIDNIIISGSYDKSIKLWSCIDNSIFINKVNVLQIQFINSRQNLLSLDLKGKLVEWKIDLVKRDFIQLKQSMNKMWFQISTKLIRDKVYYQYVINTLQ
ncbi:hypothetical protein pb186bvf_010470 [Paramecium bursaria]